MFLFQIADLDDHVASVREQAIHQAKKRAQKIKVAEQGNIALMEAQRELLSQK